MEEGSAAVQLSPGYQRAAPIHHLPPLSSHLPHTPVFVLLRRWLLVLNSPFSSALTSTTRTTTRRANQRRARAAETRQLGGAAHGRLLHQAHPSD